ncbi:MAG TPA: cytochrome c peroxidase [Flavobacteriales bacterium]|nr:cytochrome c peroxidase [Flavobacteriales bacterium]HQX28787.1 cytochrome c peroxidase [Flavobacteriales bacterium]HQX37305.1 cytochrome c peroxidase [Flavobacteriales bacterium]HQZ91671.1 cytochrome c peroxidase [Flavobacteriales bacterium]
MNMGIAQTFFSITLGVALLGSCKPEQPLEPDTPAPQPVGTPYALAIPQGFPQMPIPSDNPMTVEGIALGRFLFYEERLSGDNTQSCSTCHSPASAFSDAPNQFSTGIDGLEGDRNSMALMNLGWGTNFFWDGRSATLEQQILQPVMNPIEMHETWPNAVAKLQADEAYRQLFESAFGGTDIDSLRAAKAIAQFLRTLISGNSRFDQALRFEIALTPEEQNGIQLTQLEGGFPPDVPAGQGGADCFHCHPHGGSLFTDGVIRNNGLDAVFTDLGLGGITGLPQDMGKFKTPSLRNVALTAPYMHDGRFQTLEEVIEHYNSGGHASTTIDPNMKYTTGGLSLTPQKKAELLAFLNSLTDLDYVNNPAFSDPGIPQPQ